MISGAKLEAVSQATGLKYATSSNQYGICALAELPAGSYDVTAMAHGFTPIAIRLQVHA